MSNNNIQERHGSIDIDFSVTLGGVDFSVSAVANVTHTEHLSTPSITCQVGTWFGDEQVDDEELDIDGDVSLYVYNESDGTEVESEVDVALASAWLGVDVERLLLLATDQLGGFERV